MKLKIELDEQEPYVLVRLDESNHVTTAVRGSRFAQTSLFMAHFSAWMDSMGVIPEDYQAVCSRLAEYLAAYNASVEERTKYDLDAMEDQAGKA